LILYEALNTIIANMKPGIKIKAVHQRAFNLIKEKSPGLAEKLAKNFGFGVTTEMKKL